MDVYKLPSPTASDWYHQAENGPSHSQDDVLMYIDSGISEDVFRATDAHPATPSTEPLDSAIDRQHPLDDVVPSSYQLQTPLPLSVRLRRPALPPTVWEHFKTIIQDLYLHRQLSLEEVRKNMKQQHGFDAT
ncbi:uncharacterized protein Z519_07029 [Cladophialophora bantiana CBS 173.52]|uniref:Clr5 domain-containing protein n=1 Tax=Cladophialophora bantiana (strain ATCC 10958 / CBS 173.52 / CDC B-1940 / NIH 8579) TaxID=1442370 RepID=A0A0D2G014_CLAB1|nr:uncharacterized protein Z519_07029 [Cladophialophora bantiana CBS 173.52]KIW92047.1 hypothetical protein Z519_07029 [Cladophialophora bantiana CBS 173.52]